MQRLACLIVFGALGCVTLDASVAYAQESPTPEQLEKMYKDALVALQNAQDGKNRLAAENKNLTERLASLEKQLAQTQSELSTLKDRAAEFSERTYFLRSFYNSWRSFIQRDPQLKARWERFLENHPLLIPRDAPALLDPNWPLSTKESAS